MRIIAFLLGLFATWGFLVSFPNYPSLSGPLAGIACGCFLFAALLTTDAPRKPGP